MTPKPKLKLRMAPTLVSIEDPLQRLAALAEWTEVPSNPPPTGPAAELIAPAAALQQAQQPAPVQASKKEKAEKAWDGPAAMAPHPYHLVLNEGLFQKMDFVWKRAGHKSMREWAIKTLEHEANKALKGMGEL